MNKISTKLIFRMLSSLLLCQPLSALAANSDLHVLVPPSHNIDKTTVHFSSVYAVNPLSTEANHGYIDTSDEYWLEVTGEQLANGVDIPISGKNALIRLSSNRNNDNEVIERIEPEAIELSRDGNLIPTPFKHVVTAEKLATANIFPNSHALTINDNLATGLYQLKVNQPLNKVQRFILNVKEKQSPYKTAMTVSKQRFFAGEQVHFTTSLLANGIQQNQNVLSKSQNNKRIQTAKIKLPNGIMKKVPIHYTRNDLFIKMPDDHINDYSPGALHELHLSSINYINGIEVRRNNKIAFNYVIPTANITKQPNILTSKAVFSLDVASEGRYELSAIVSGKNDKGESEPFMLSRSAYYLTPGKHTLDLRFDDRIVGNSKLSPPFLLNEVKLVDQSRLQQVNH